MDLTHEFTVPASKAETWAALNDLESVAGCFPGAAVDSVEGDTFTGSCKVKLGPIALVYKGSGSFIEKDEAAGVMKIEAKGKDKRGNGTAGADVVATITEASATETHVQVVTDLSITGKPAQFGRGVIQDISDKLLGQFVECLKTKVGNEADGDAGASGGAGVEPEAGGTGAVGAEAAAVPASPDPAATGAGATASTTTSAGGRHAAESPAPTRGSGTSAAPADGDDALDLGATVLPILLKTYGKQLAAGLGVVALLVWILRRR